MDLKTEIWFYVKVLYSTLLCKIQHSCIFVACKSSLCSLFKKPEQVDLELIYKSINRNCLYLILTGK